MEETKDERETEEMNETSKIPSIQKSDKGNVTMCKNYNNCSQKLLLCTCVFYGL